MSTISESMKEGIVPNTPSSDALVFFGATGDLAHKKKFPALQALAKRGNCSIWLWQTWKTLKTNPLCYRLVSQQIGSADSICANIEEGYGRLSRVEYVRFLDIARGSARETRGRYERMKHWLDQDVIQQWITLLDGIIGILTKSIGTMRKK